MASKLLLGVLGCLALQTAAFGAGIRLDPRQTTGRAVGEDQRNNIGSSVVNPTTTPSESTQRSPAGTEERSNPGLGPEDNAGQPRGIEVRGDAEGTYTGGHGTTHITDDEDREATAVQAPVGSDEWRKERE